MILTNWANYPKIDCNVDCSLDLNSIYDTVEHCNSLITRGNGLSYSDAAFNQNKTLILQKMNRILDFDEEKGIITAEAGITLEEILKVIVPKHWIIPVLPGTAKVTLGGAVASDIHGKNHHKKGCISNFIKEFSIIALDNDPLVVESNDKTFEGLFDATCGGMGLTGIILRVTLQLERIETSYISQTTIKTCSLEETLHSLKESNKEEMSLAWINMGSKKHLGSAIIYTGHYAKPEELHNVTDSCNYTPSRKLNIPFTPAKSLINYPTIKIFDYLYYRHHKPDTKCVPLDQFFFPLDGIRNWNRLYGSAGIQQYQFVIPESESDILPALFRYLCIEEKAISPLAVMKLCGEHCGRKGSLSFPIKGISLAMDFPCTPHLMNVLNHVNELLLDHGGRIYLAKDGGIMERSTFMQMYKEQFEEFMETKLHYDPHCRYTSLLSQRLMGF